MVADLLVRLVPTRVAQRFPDDRTESLAGCTYRASNCAEACVETATFAVASWFALPPFR